MQKAFMIVFGWLLRGAQLKFILFTTIAALFTFLLSFVVPEISDFVNTGGLNSAFSSIDTRVWYFINLMNLVSGITLIISAYIARFIIRRLPFIG
ncbi:MAG: DUF2523 family protein [Methylotenera sp.]|uniref:DUF2523 family protein n=1 Tax=Methylotenera sp. TaxID=2051956 RepID=UPI00272F5D3E|nr:DUF2523 family protein [Methylotenera sp.]MDP1522838.1 DUF2523 family protein [Methylotenera sp.]